MVRNPGFGVSYHTAVQYKNPKKSQEFLGVALRTGLLFKGRQPQAWQRSHNPGIFVVSCRQPSRANPKPEQARSVVYSKYEKSNLKTQ